MPRTAKAKRQNRPRQPYLPGDDMAPPSIPVIDEAASAYVEIRNNRMELSKEEKAAHESLLALMKDKGLEVYEYEDMVVRLDSKTKVRVRKKKEETDGADEE